MQTSKLSRSQRNAMEEVRLALKKLKQCGVVLHNINGDLIGFDRRYVSDVGTSPRNTQGVICMEFKQLQIEASSILEIPKLVYAGTQSLIIGLTQKGAEMQSKINDRIINNQKQKNGNTNRVQSRD